MTTYGTIPTSVSPPSPSFQFVSLAKDRIRTGLGTRRPWREMASPRAMSRPNGTADAIVRIRTNASYFRMNYAIIVLFVLFLSLLWHPISLIVFVVMMAAWLFLYFLRDEPLVIFNRIVDDRIILISLSIATIGLLFLTEARVNIAAGLVVGVAAAAVHGAFWRTDELVTLDEDEGEGEVRSRAGWPRTPMVETASSLFSSSS